MEWTLTMTTNRETGYRPTQSLDITNPPGRAELQTVTLWRCPDYHVKDVAALFENGSGVCLTCGKGLVQRTYTETYADRYGEEG